MTVCVAAIGVFPMDAAMNLGNVVVGASDRMLTAGDVQFEPQQSKIAQLTSAIALMVAGDTSLQVEIISDLQAEINRRVAAQPTSWLKVADVAGLYVDFYNKAKAARATNAILTPLGLTGDDFIGRQRDMAPELVKEVASELISFELPELETIVAGMDDTGGHLFVIDHGRLSCRDNVGFAAIGAGYWHANSHLMFTGHIRSKLMPETLLVAYSAKKRAEVAPGVGPATDMFLIGPVLGNYVTVGQPMIERLDAIYKAEQDAIKKASETAIGSINQFIIDTIKETVAKTATAGPAEQVAEQNPPGAEAPATGKT